MQKIERENVRAQFNDDSYITILVDEQLSSGTGCMISLHDRVQRIPNYCKDYGSWLNTPVPCITWLVLLVTG